MIVIKIGGEATSDLKVAEEISLLSEKHQLIIVHGGGDEVTYYAEKLGVKQRFIISPSGFKSRITDEETMKIYLMVMTGLIAKRIAINLIKFGLKPICISGIEGNSIVARKKDKIIERLANGRKRILDAGFTGIIESIDKEMIQLLINNGFIPVISPVAISKDFEPLNVDSDRMASKIAINFNAEKLIFLTDVNGVYLDGKLVEKMNLKECEEFIEKVSEGMKMKLLASLEALKKGVKEVIIMNYKNFKSNQDLNYYGTKINK